MILRNLLVFSLLSWSVGLQAQVPCNPLFTVSATTSSISGNVVSLFASSTFPVVGAYWTYSDGGSSYGWPQTVYTFTQSGFQSYCVSAWYWDPIAQDTCWADYCDSLLISGTSSPCDSTASVFFQPTDFGNGQFFFNGTGTMLFNGYVWSFGDGNSFTTNLPSVTYNYNQSGAYVACVDAWYFNATNDTCWVSHCDTLIVSGISGGCDSTAFVDLFSSFVAGSTFEFFAQGSQAFSQYVWDFGDGNSTTTFTPSVLHQFTIPGSYTVCLDAYYFSPLGDTCWVSDCTTITVVGSACDSTAFVDISAIQLSGNLFNFAATGNQFFGGYVWNFGDGNSITTIGPQVSYQYPVAGLYSACVEAWYFTPFGDTCWVTDCIAVNAGGVSPCDSSAYVSVTSTFVSSTLIVLSATSNQSLVGFIWDFGDGNSWTAGPSVTYQYAQPGTYMVCVQAWYLTLTNDTCWVDDCITVNIAAGSPCDSTAYVDMFPQNTFGNNYNFQLTGNQSFVFYEWDFGDGNANSTTLPFTSHTYQFPGTYLVCVEAGYLTLTNDTCWVVDCDTIIVGGGTLICDSVNWSVDFNMGITGNFVQFNDQSNTAGFGATYFWDFGDGTTSTLQNPLHDYQAPGTYGPCLYVAIGINNGADSCFMVHCDTVFISMTGGCDSTAFIDLGANSIGGGVFTFSTTGNQSFGGYVWSFGDGSSASGPSPQVNYQYAFNGAYMACVEAWYLTAFGDTCWVVSCDTVNAIIGFVSDANVQTSVKVFPNPTTELLNINIDEDARIEAIDVFDLQGRRVIQKSAVFGNRVALSVAHLGKGTYLLAVHSDQGTVQQCFVLE